MLTPLYTNYLSVPEFAEVGYLFAVIAVINIIYGFGMDSAFFRFYEKDDEEQSNRVFTLSYISILCISGFFSVVVIIFSGSLAPVMTDLPNGSRIITLAALIPFLDSLMVIPFAFLRMTRQAKKFALTRFSLVIVAVVLNVIFVVVLRWGIEGVLWAQIIANAIGGLVFVQIIYTKINFKFDFKLLWEMLKFGIPTIPAMLSGIILQVGDRWILKPMVSTMEFALYQCNYKLGIPMIMLVSVFEYAWKPFYLSHYKDADAKKLFARILTYFTMIAAVIFLVTSMFMDYLVRMPFVGGKFINPEYWSGMGIIPIVLFAYYFNGVYNNIACGFHIEKKTKYLPLAIGFGAILNIVMNFILIPFIGYWGAAWTTLGSYFISAVVLYIYSRKIYPIEYEWFRLIKIFLLTCGIYALAMVLTADMPIIYSFIARVFGLVLFFVIISTMGFFTQAELRKIKSIFKH
jgi:O-antigen/teichoic acid export membrane protein